MTAAALALLLAAAAALGALIRPALDGLRRPADDATWPDYQPAAVLSPTAANDRLERMWIA